MKRLQSLAVTLIGFGFTAMGLFLLFTSETGDDLLMGGVTTLFFAAVGLVGLIDLLPAALPRPQADGRLIVRAARLNRRFNMPPYALAPGTSGVDFNALADSVFALWETHRAPEASA